MKANQRNGWNELTAAGYVRPEKPKYSLSDQLEKKYEYENGKRTDKVSGYKAWFTQEGLPPFEVKFAEKIELPKYLSVIEFENLEAVEVRYNVYFRADGIKVVK